MEKITERINNLVEELAEGNGKKFADKANIKQATFYNYMNGRIPNVESLGNICRTYQVSLNWLIEGIGEKYLFNETKMVKCEFLETVDSWLSDLKKDDPENEAWFRVQFKKLFPEFNKWLQRKNGAEGRDTSISKVA